MTLKEFSKIMKNELTSHSSDWIQFRWYLNNKYIDPNQVIPFGYVYYYGNYLIDHFCLNDTMKTMSIYLKSDLE